MCGIIGIVAPSCGEREQAAVVAGLVTLAQRGPDAEGLLVFPHSILGHRRLSIIDIAGGAQPMKDSGGNLAITFNGEIYNYKKLRAALEKAGHTFRTQSDTEVILEAYRAYGQKCVDHFDGMFAFAIWDESKQKLFLARDRFGEKPLYYAHSGNTFLFASEIKALLATELIKQKLDLVSLDNYLSLSYIPPWRTAYADIQTLPPAHHAVFKNGVITQTRYWQLHQRPLTVSQEEAAETVRTMLAESVKSRLVADVEVGAFLSGGIDSSIVTTLAQEAMRTRKIKTFSAGFEDFINELPYAEEIAYKLGANHHPTHIRLDLVEALRDTAGYFDEPFADSSNIPVHLLSQFARKHVSVVLAGDGGDELFFGYGHYRRHWHLPLKQKLHRLLSDPFEYFPAHLPQYFSPRERTELWKDSSAVERDLATHLDLSEAKTNLQKINLIDFQLILPGDILTKVDRSSMMHSLEVRSPFLQHELAEFVYNLPDDYKTNRTQGKLLLAHAFKDLIPAHFFTRKKQGFGAPIKEWLKKPDIQKLVETVGTPGTRLGLLIHEKNVRSIVEAYQRGNDHLARRVWTLLTLELWMQSHPGVTL